MAVVIRPSETSDYDGIVSCLRRNEMQPLSRERWLSLWNDYPHRHEFQGVPRGFVLEVDGVIVGSISSIWAKYVLGGRELRAVFAGSAAVDPAHRTWSIKLFGEQLLKHGADLYFNTSASAATSKIMDVLKVPRVPQPDNDLTLLWAVNGRPVAAAGLRKRNVPLSGALAIPVGLGLRMASRLAMARGGRARYPVKRVDSFSGQFDDLWHARRESTTKLIAVRDSATLGWRYGRLITAGDAVALTAERDGRLAGYAVLVRTRRPGLGIVAYAIQDLQCIDDDPSITASLLAGAWKATKRDRLDLLEFAGFTGARRAIAERSSILRHRIDVWQAFYYCREPSLKKALAEPAPWDISGYDCD